MSTILTDASGDGLTDGNGLSLSYNDASILSIPLYDTGTYSEGGSYWVAEFGDCGGLGNDDGSGDDDQGGSGGDDDDQGGTGDDDGSDKDDDCLDVVVALTTDSEADEMGLIISDITDEYADSTTILLYEFGDLVDNISYEDEVWCLDTSRCYLVMLLDKGSAGFVSTGGLEVTVNSETMLSVGPGDVGQYDPDFNVLWWAVTFGNCPQL
jgi:hypothetical protein